MGPGRFQKLCSLEYQAMYEVKKLINPQLELEFRIDLGLNHFKKNNVRELRGIRSDHVKWRLLRMNSPVPKDFRTPSSAKSQ
jgi:hypothetical protein